MNELTHKDGSNQEKYFKNRSLILDFIHDTSFSIINMIMDTNSPQIFIKLKSESIKFRRIDFSKTNMIQKLSLYIKLLAIIQKLIESNQYATKRDIYYQFKHIFKSQIALDSLINDLARTLSVPRSSFHILSSPKGLMAGNLELILNDGSYINCKSIKNGVLIPSLINLIQDIKANASFVLIVEKEATFQRLIDDNFLNKYQAILITGKGEPDINTRELLHLIYKKYEKSVKFFCLTDANPYGLQILSVYKYGSKALLFNNLNIDLPQLEWIGLKINDLSRFYLKDHGNYLLKLNKHDIQIANSLIKKFTFLKQYDLVDQLQLMLENNSKAELQYLQNISNSFLCDVYLKVKLEKILNS